MYYDFVGCSVKSPIASLLGCGRDLTDRSGPTLGNVDKLISQIPTLPPVVPGRGVVGQYVDRCIMGEGVLTYVLQIYKYDKHDTR